MNPDVTSTSTANPVIPAILGIIAVLLIVSVFANIKLPILASDRAVLIALILVGGAMCASGGIGPSLAQYGWLHAVPIIGSVLGALILLIGVLTLIGVQLPLITSERAAIAAIAAISVVKILVMGLARLVA